MLEVIVLIAVLAIIIMAWGRVSKGIDWAGARIGETGDMLSDLTVSGAIQTNRGVVISSDSREDTLLESEEKSAKRDKKRSAFVKKMTADEKKNHEVHQKKLEKLVRREY